MKRSNFCLLIVLFIWFSGQIFAQDSIQIIGIYSNERSDDGEHSYGYSLYLWQYQDSIIGIFSIHEGLIGTATTGIISNAEIYEDNEITFSTSLYDQKVTFKGIKDEESIKGDVFWENAETDFAQQLDKCCTDALTHDNFKSLKDWKRLIKGF